MENEIAGLGWRLIREKDGWGDVEEALEPDLGEHICDLAQVSAPLGGAACEEVLDDPCPDRVSHPVELLVDGGIILVVLYELYDECAVGQSEELGVLV